MGKIDMHFERSGKLRVSMDDTMKSFNFTVDDFVNRDESVVLMNNGQPVVSVHEDGILLFYQRGVNPPSEERSVRIKTDQSEVRSLINQVRGNL